jgi:hypothetical protein
MMASVRKFIRGLLEKVLEPQLAPIQKALELTRAAATEQALQAQKELELLRAAAAEQAQQAQKELELTRAHATAQARQAQEQVELTRAHALEQAQQAQKELERARAQAAEELELARAQAAEQAQLAQKELDLARAAARTTVQTQIRRHLRQVEIDMRIGLQHLERELESTRTENWQTHQRLTKCLDENRRLEIKLTETPEIDYQLLMMHQEKEAAFRDLNPTFMQLYDRVKSFSMTSIERLYAMFQATDYVSRNNIIGDLVECGVWRGGSMMMAALTLLELNDTSRSLYLFDTFEGLPRPGEEDEDFAGNKQYNEWTRHRRTDSSSDWAYASIEEVRANLESIGYPTDKVIFVKGMVQDTLPNNAPNRIALLRLDTDWYQSTAWELKHLYERLSANGVLIIDDYGHLKGQRKAVDEFFAERGEHPLLQRIDYSGRLLLKPL